MAKKTGTAVHVVLDTNSLFTEAADKLVSRDVSEFILATNSQAGLTITWYLPWIVKLSVNIRC
jgi:hypothetical protein